MPKSSSSRKLESPEDLVAYVERRIEHRVAVGKIRNRLYEMGFERSLIEKAVREAQKRRREKAVEDVSMEISMPTNTAISLARLRGAGPPPPPQGPKVKKRKGKRGSAIPHPFHLVPSVELHPIPANRPSIRIEDERRHLNALGSHHERLRVRHSRRWKRLQKRMLIGAIVALLVLNPFSLLNWLIGLAKPTARQTQVQTASSEHSPLFQITPSATSPTLAPRMAIERRPAAASWDAPHPKRRRAHR
jgi:hypothetical protein